MILRCAKHFDPSSIAHLARQGGNLVGQMRECDARLYVRRIGGQARIRRRHCKFLGNREGRRLRIVFERSQVSDGCSFFFTPRAKAGRYGSDSMVPRSQSMRSVDACVPSVMSV